MIVVALFTGTGWVFDTSMWIGGKGKYLVVLSHTQTSHYAAGLGLKLYARNGMDIAFKIICFKRLQVICTFSAVSSGS